MKLGECFFRIEIFLIYVTDIILVHEMVLEIYILYMYNSQLKIMFSYKYRPHLFICIRHK